MADLGSVFNANEVEPATGVSDPLPPGEYVAHIVDSEKTETKNGQNAYLKLECEISEGEFKGRKFWHNLNLWNSSSQASEIAAKEFSALCHACLPEAERNSVSDSEVLHYKPFLAKLTVEGAKGDYPAKNLLKKISSADGAAPAAAPTPSTPAAKQAPAAGSAPPWAAK